MSARPRTTAALLAALPAALAAGTREAFTALLTDDVHWGGERPDADHECTTREQAGNHYAHLLAADVSLRFADLHATGTTAAGDLVTARLLVRSPDPDDFAPETSVRLTVRHGLIADIRVLDGPDHHRDHHHDHDAT